MIYTKLFNRLKTPQAKPIPGSGQVPNHAGGYAWAIDRWQMLERFLILGSENGTFYVGAQKLTADHAENVLKCIEEDGVRVVNQAVAISESGRAPKNDAAIFVLALVASVGNDQARSFALEAMPRVCRTGTHLFAFAAACDEMRGWGRGLRKAVGRWYNAQDPASLEYLVVKYAQREGWSHRDLLRLSHPVPASDAHKNVFKWVVDAEAADSLALVNAVKGLTGAGVKQAAEAIRANRIPREAVPTELLREPEIWEALLQLMPLTALLRNLGNLAKCGLLVANSDAEKQVLKSLSNVDHMKKARVHPISVLVALRTYGSGKGFKGSGEWTPTAMVVDALDKAFYATFDSVEPTGKRLMLGIDVSGSMAGTLVNGATGLECRQAAAAMALVTMATEKSTECVAFDTNAYPLTLSPNQRLDDVVQILAKTGGGGTDCAIPIAYALKNRIAVDAFVIYTDSETWQGQQHPAQAINEYRKKMGIPAKLVVVAMASNRVTVGDVNDPGTLNVVGFDASVPHVISTFLRN